MFLQKRLETAQDLKPAGALNTDINTVYLNRLNVPPEQRLCRENISGKYFLFVSDHKVLELKAEFERECGTEQMHLPGCLF